ncbi:hypothetical protein E2C01_083803 [Portunus trituberculatus]|uniref:Uncharacterized protein n=1 Tax=Portunus trituberculatus TaxID=210409 RepID=A0A5B7IW52_PORTR|nr:hypothetical protein [Portunus trituberculatus]
MVRWYLLLPVVPRYWTHKVWGSGGLRLAPGSACQEHTPTRCGAASQSPFNGPLTPTPR